MNSTTGSVPSPTAASVSALNPQAVQLNLEGDFGTGPPLGEPCSDEGDNPPCQSDDIRRILDMHKNYQSTAALYVAIIVGCYLFGLLVLLVHHVKQKHGQVSLYDIYLEIVPGSWCGSGGSGNAHVSSPESSREITSFGEEDECLSEPMPERTKRRWGLSQSLKMKKHVCFGGSRRPSAPMPLKSDDCESEFERGPPTTLRSKHQLRLQPIEERKGCCFTAASNKASHSSKYPQQESIQMRGKRNFIRSPFWSRKRDNRQSENSSKSAKSTGGKLDNSTRVTGASSGNNQQEETLIIHIETAEGMREKDKSKERSSGVAALAYTSKDDIAKRQTAVATAVSSSSFSTTQHPASDCSKEKRNEEDEEENEVEEEERKRRKVKETAL